jgi:signal transduction histidine kinase
MRAFWLTAYEPAIQTELFRLGLRNLLTNAAADAILPCVLAAGVWHAVDHDTVWRWWACAMGADGLAWLTWLAWRHKRELAADQLGGHLSAWQWTHLATVSLMGASWGYAGVLFVPALPVHNLLVIAGFQGVLAYSSASNASHDLLAFVVSLVCAGLVMTQYVPQAMLHTDVYMYLMLWLFLGALCIVAFHSHRTILISIRLRLDNEALARKNADIAAQAQQASRDKSTFLAAASHDLRQPVHALLLLIEALRAKERAGGDTTAQADGDAERRVLIDHIALAGQSIGSLFNALMELSRLESGT